MSTISNPELNDDLDKAKGAADLGPVGIADLLAMPEADEIELELIPSRDLPKDVDLSWLSSKA